ncbi:MAG: nucleotide exchange factor GrpE [Planctomycetota bacterium]|nr:nucleotide exchange factor GrpE [Planctomycetota bacterium]
MSENGQAQENNDKIKSAYEKATERMDSNQPENSPEDTQDAPGAEATADAESGSSENSEEKQTVQAQAEVVENDDNASNLDYKDKYLRARADLENYRMRINREKESWRANAVRSMAMSFIDILDNLNLALSTTNSNEDVNDPTFLKGVTAVRDQLKNQLEQRGVRQIEAKSGDTFDPDQHEALMVQESADVEGQVVGLILRPGYMLDKQVLRPTQIQVLKGS